MKPLPGGGGAPEGGVADFAGTWDTQTFQGGHFLLTLTVDGENVTGTFSDINGNPQYAGTLSGSWKNDHISYTWTQPQTGVSGTGTFKVYTNGRLDGGITYKPAGAVQPQYVWWRGTRKSAGVAGGGTPAGGTSAGSAGTSATAKKATDVYPDNSGKSQRICAMDPGDKGTFLERKPGEPDWVHLSGISGGCGGREGWVWNGGSLSIP